MGRGFGRFAAYGTADHDSTTMTISNDRLRPGRNQQCHHGDDSTSHRGYSACTVRITYACTVNSSADVVYGDGGNPNEVQLTWKRTNTDYYDTLEDDCHFYALRSGSDQEVQRQQEASPRCSLSCTMTPTTTGSRLS